MVLEEASRSIGSEHNVTPAAAVGHVPRKVLYLRQGIALHANRCIRPQSATRIQHIIDPVNTLSQPGVC